MVAGETETRPLHALSFDVEEYFQVSAFWSPERRGQWDTLESRVDMSTRRITELLAARETKATFFVLGWVAERNPALVRHLTECGHEVASHGYGHELVNTLSSTEFRNDVRKAKRILEDIVGKPVVGYRAPSFSIAGESMDWALRILVEEGHLYDSSLYYRFLDRPTIPQSSTSCYAIETGAGSILESAPATARACGLSIPAGGGGYFRLIPYPLLRYLLKRLEKEREQIVMYFHPWELDPDQPRMQGALLSRVRHYMNLDKTEGRLRALLDDFKFGSISEVMAPIRELRCGHGASERGAVETQEMTSKLNLLYSSHSDGTCWRDRCDEALVRNKHKSQL